MALPQDNYPLATADSLQIRSDFMRPSSLHVLGFTTGTGSTPALAGQLNLEVPYSLVASAECIVDFTAVASITPNGAPALYIRPGERLDVFLPNNATGISCIGLVAAGTLYVQQLVAWASLANANARAVR